jgi:hypothetical protein
MRNPGGARRSGTTPGKFRGWGVWVTTAAGRAFGGDHEHQERPTATAVGAMAVTVALGVVAWLRRAPGAEVTLLRPAFPKRARAQ